jgi:hypothetical protein
MAFGMATLLGALAAQDKVEFDAASIKANSLRSGLVINTTKGGDFTAENVTLRNLMGTPIT